MSFKEKKASFTDENSSVKLDKTYTGEQTYNALMRNLQRDAERSTDQEEIDKLGKWYISLLVLRIFSLPAFIGHEPLLLHGSMLIVWWAVVIDPMNIINIRQLLEVLVPQDIDFYWLGNREKLAIFKQLLAIHSGCLYWDNKPNRREGNLNIYDGIVLPCGWELFTDSILIGTNVMATSIFDVSKYNIPMRFEHLKVNVDIKVRGIVESEFEPNYWLRKWTLTSSKSGDRCPESLLETIRSLAPNLSQMLKDAYSGTHLCPQILLATSSIVHPKLSKNMKSHTRFGETMSDYIKMVKHAKSMDHRHMLPVMIPRGTHMASREFVRNLQSNILKRKMPVLTYQRLDIPLWALSCDGTNELFGFIALWYVKLLVRERDVKQRLGLTGHTLSGKRKELARSLKELRLCKIPVIKDLKLYRYMGRVKDISISEIRRLGERAFDYWVTKSASFTRNIDGSLEYYDIFTMETIDNPDAGIIFTGCQHASRAGELKEKLQTQTTAMRLAMGMQTFNGYQTNHQNCACCRAELSNTFGGTRCDILSDAILNQTGDNLYKMIGEGGDIGEIPMHNSLVVMPGLYCMDQSVQYQLCKMIEDRASKQARNEAMASKQARNEAMVSKQACDEAMADGESKKSDRGSNMSKISRKNTETLLKASWVLAHKR